MSQKKKRSETCPDRNIRGPRATKRNAARASSTIAASLVTGRGSAGHPRRRRNQPKTHQSLTRHRSPTRSLSGRRTLSRPRTRTRMGAGQWFLLLEGLTWRSSISLTRATGCRRRRRSRRPLLPPSATTVASALSYMTRAQLVISHLTSRLSPHTPLSTLPFTLTLPISRSFLRLGLAASPYTRRTAAHSPPSSSRKFSTHRLLGILSCLSVRWIKRAIAPPSGAGTLTCSDQVGIASRAFRGPRGGCTTSRIRESRLTL